MHEDKETEAAQGHTRINDSEKAIRETVCRAPAAQDRTEYGSYDPIFPGYEEVEKLRFPIFPGYEEVEKLRFPISLGL